MNYLEEFNSCLYAAVMLIVCGAIYRAKC